MSVLDHLVLGTGNLEHGAAWLERFLGVQLGPTGRHPRMGTHNRLLSLGPEQYLELIAIDPQAPQPELRRWFGLDTADVRERIAQRPRLIGWVARCTDIDGMNLRTGSVLGTVLPMQRADYRWRITVPEDGYPLEGGLIPHLIQWDVPLPPPASLTDQGCRFEWMEAAHPNPAKVDYLLNELGLSGTLKLTPSPPYSGMSMCAYIRTPRGTRTLMS
ncbi:MAG TPA: VOC family protein [Usitatibacteraceae bacterium]|nr:VOC family protein [Usitatibacteraceae bacterium]